MKRCLNCAKVFESLYMGPSMPGYLGFLTFISLWSVIRENPFQQTIHDR